MTTADLTSIPIIDVDSHVIEPPDLWTSRMSAKHADILPQVVWDEKSKERRWRVGDVLLSSEGTYASAGWHEPFPAHPPTLSECEPASYEPTARLLALDETGVQAQVLYPNLIGFDSNSFLTELGPTLATDAVRAYNDFIHEFASTNQERLIPIAMLPYWDLEATLAELDRVKSLDFKGVLMAVLFSRIGQKNLSDSYWDPVLSVIQDNELSINIHIGFNNRIREEAERDTERLTNSALEGHTNRLSIIKQLTLSKNSVIEAVAELILQGTFERFPRLKVVSVESGFGYLPFVLDNMDWQWQTTGAIDEYPLRELPSVYWRRNFYATFWFERSSLPLLEYFQDNVMFETDFPHETGIYPGLWQHNKTAREAVRESMEGVVPPQVAEKVLSGNAAKLYGVTL